MLGIVTGLKFEAAVLARALAVLPEARRPLVLCHGMGEERAGRAARALVDQGATTLVSAGISGGLMPQAQCGTLTLASAAVHPHQGPIACDWPLRATLLAAAGKTHPATDAGPIAHAADVVDTPAAKLALGSATGAWSVDMESWPVAQAARAAGLPFGVIRVVADPYDQPLPMELLTTLSWDGHIETGRLARTLASKPWLLPTALTLGRHSARAKAVLGRAGHLLAQALNG